MPDEEAPTEEAVPERVSRGESGGPRHKRHVKQHKTVDCSDYTEPT